ncbi:calcium/proton exchanger [Paludisphaera mucosa]|uniref:Ca(2+)/H(+) antiporter n=1 Tax=Paludisphaera mucosa TaxID=3030827 RepID=A0ABT6FI26_9BACT|nr:calcium/proton exchanger [Paludisphaera mucosa]MDG3007169.1 calcium/proton exchanger [Paludisphaera mucosa]
MDQARVNRLGEGADPGGPIVAAAGPWWDFLDPRESGWLMALLLAVPVAVGLRFAGAGPIWLFLASCLAIVPLAGLMGRATEQLAERLGPGIGGLLNATFGNAAELIIALFALFNGLDEVVKASLTGSIIGNILLVLGASLLAGGLKYDVQRFNRTAAGVGSTMMVLAAIGMLVPAIFHALPEVTAADLILEHELSVGVSIVLLLAYAAHLIFSLKTHKGLFNPEPTEVDSDLDAAHVHGPLWSTSKSVGVLIGATLFVAWMSEILVGAVEGASHALGMNGVFVGVIVVAIVGNAAEHSTAVLVAMKNQMDLAVGIAIGSSLQIALFVAPVLVLASYLRAQPMDLLFSSLEVLAVLISVAIARMVAEDGESNWLEGLMLLTVYVILALAFFFLPARAGRHAEPHAAAAVPTAFATPASHLRSRTF